MQGNTKITGIKGRTIHSDGTVIPLTVKPEDLLSSKITGKNGEQFQFGRKVFTLPSVEVGSILEYRYEIRYDDNHASSPTGEIQRPYFVHHALYSFTPFKAFLNGGQNATSMYITDAHGDVANTLIWWPILPPGVPLKADATGIFRLELADIPAAPDEEWMPPIDGLLYHVTFYYKSAHDASEFCVSEAKRWSKEVDHFAEPSKSIKSADGTLTGSVDSFHFGPKGAGLRSFLKYTDDKERREYWEKYVAETLPGVTLDAFQFVQPAALDKPIEFHYKVTARQYSHQAGPLVLVRPRVVGSDAAPFDDKPRVNPIDLDATGRWRDSFDITIPSGYVVDEMPDPVSIDLDFASYHSSVSAKGNLLHYEREYVVRQVEIPPAKAANFRRLEIAILADEKDAAVLKKQ